MAKKKSSLSWLLKSTGKEKLGIILLTVVDSINSASGVLSALVLKLVIDGAVSRDKNGFVFFTVAFSAIIILQILLRAIARRLDESTRSGIENIFKKRTYDVILSRDYTALKAFHTGELQNRMTNDTVVIAEGMTTILPNVTAMTVKLVGASAVLIALDIRFALIFLIGGFMLLFVTYAFRRAMKKLHKRVQEADGRVRSYLQETVENLLVLRSFGGESEAAEQVEMRMKNHRNQRMKRNVFSNFCNIGFGGVMNGGYLLGLIWCGFGIIDGKITYGTLTAVLQLVNQIQQPFASVTGYLPKYYSMLASAERLMELEKLQADSSAPKISDTRRDELYSRLDSIRMDNISFCYEDGVCVIRNDSYTIKKGEFIAVAGRSGIGKSTLLKLLLAFYHADKGEMYFLLDKNERVKIDASTRPMFAYVPQGSFLMSGSISDAVSFKSELDMGKLRKCCEIACADGFISELPNGYETIIGEKGAGLSEGQIQRLAVARAIYSGAPVLLMDESTSALDEETEKRLLGNLKNMTDKTVIIVTHRRAAVEVCSREITLKSE